MASRGSRLDWLIFLALGFFWGSSYLFIKIGVDHGLQPFTLIMFRLLIGFVLLATVVAIAREPLPRDPRMYGHLFVMGVINIAIPFSLITFAEQTVDSSLAAVINGAVPLFVIVIAALFLKGETITINRVAGLADRVRRRRDPRRARRHGPRLGEHARRARPDRGDDLVRGRQRLREGPRPRPAADDPGALPGRSSGCS